MLIAMATIEGRPEFTLLRRALMNPLLAPRRLWRVRHRTSYNNVKGK